MKTGVIRFASLLGIFLTALAGTEAVRANGYHSDHPKAVHSVALSADGKLVATGCDNGIVKIFDLASGKRLQSLAYQNSSINSVVFSPDSKLVAFADNENKIQIFDPVSGKDLRTIGDIDSQCSLAFSPDGKILASANRDVSLWSMANGELICKLPGTASGAQDIAFSADGNQIVVGGSDNTVKIWDVKEHKELRSLSGHTGAVAAVAVSPDSKTIASGGDDESIKLWDMASGKELASLEGHDAVVSSLAFSPDGKQLVSASYCGDIRIWDVTTGKQLWVISANSSSPPSTYVASVAFSSDGKFVAGGTEDSIKLWEVSSGKELHAGELITDDYRSSSGHNYTIYKGYWDTTIPARFTLERPEKTNSEIALCIPAAFVTPQHQIDGLALMNGKSVGGQVDTHIGGAALIIDGDYDIFRMQAGNVLSEKIVSQLQKANASLFQQFQLVCDGVAEHFKDNSSYQRRALVVFDDASKAVVESKEKITLSDFAKDLQIMSARDALYTDMGEYAEGWYRTNGAVKSMGQESLSTASQNNWLVFEKSTAEADKIDDDAYAYPMPAHRWLEGHLGIGGKPPEPETVSRMVNYVAFSPDGTMFATGNVDGTIGIFDRFSAKQMRSMIGHKDLVYSVAFSPDGRTLASSSADRTIKYWNLADGKEICTVAPHSGYWYAVAFSPDGRLLAGCNNKGSIQFWDSLSGREAGNLAGHKKAVSWIAFSPDGRLLASASRDRTTKIWDVATGKELFSLADTNFLETVAFSPDSKTVATGADYQTIKLWDAGTGRLISAVGDLKGFSTTLVFGADGKTLASGNVDSTVVLWDVNSGKEMRRFSDASSGRAVAFSRDGKLLAIGMGDSTVKLFDPATGKEMLSTAVRPEVIASASGQDDSANAQSSVPVSQEQDSQKPEAQKQESQKQEAQMPETKQGAEKQQPNKLEPGKQEAKKTPSEEVHFTAEQLKEYYAVYSLPDVKYLRTLFNVYLSGAPATPGERVSEYAVLKNWKDPYLHSKFIVLSRTIALFGGTSIKLMFEDRPDKIFSAWVYLKDKNAKHPVFALRALDLDKYSDEQMQGINKRYRQFIQDKVHAM